MINARFKTSPFLLLWLFASATVVVLLLLQEIETRIYAQQREQTDEQLLTQILANVAYNNDLLMDTFLLDPATNTFAQNDLLGLTTPRAGFIARDQGRPIAFVLPVETLEGYNGSIKLMIGITVDGETTGVRIVAHNETPRLGDKIELAISDWVLNFNNRSLDNTDARLWRVKKEGGEFDQFAGATITPRAVVGAVRNALEFFAVNKETFLTMNGAQLSEQEPQSQLIASALITTWLAALMQPIPLFLLALLIAIRNHFTKRHYPNVTPSTETTPGSKRVRVTGKL